MTTIEPIRTIADIARVCGVSKSTVSRALSNSPLISAETRTRIQALAQAHNFEVHQGARSLSRQKTETVAVIIPVAPESGYYLTEHPFNLELLAALTNAVADYGYDLLGAQVSITKQYRLDRPLTSKRADGLIVFACDILGPELARLVKERAPFVMWGPPAPEQNYCTVGSDDAQGGYLATRHLLTLGRRRVAFISGPKTDPEGLLRYQGYKKALVETGMPVDESLIETGDYGIQAGYEKMGRLLDRQPEIDGLFAASDAMAMGAIQALRERNRAIPQDIAVVGFDGIPLSTQCNPPLTTVKQDLARAGRVMVRNLLQYLDDGVVTNAIIPVELIVRQSTMG